MKDIEKCKNVIAKRNNFDSFEKLINYTFNRELLQSEKDLINKVIAEIAKLYSEEYYFVCLSPGSCIHDSEDDDVKCKDCHYWEGKQ